MKDTYVVWRVYEEGIDGPVKVYVINQKTHIIHTSWKDLFTARQVCKDLNNSIEDEETIA